MANRRTGGMGGLQRGARNSQQFNPFQGGGGSGSNVSPWQGAPGLGSNNSMAAAGGFISQITSNPQQLALALSSLLQPQQQSPQHHQINQANPPSLLSLNTSPSFPSAGNQNRFDRFGGGGGGAGGGFGNRVRDFRRHEPYNKNRNAGGWRPMDNNRNRRRDNGGNRKGGGGGIGDKNRKPNQKSDKKVNEVKVTDNREIKDVKDPNDINLDESHDGEVESKRDWKDEKNDAAEKADPDENIEADDSKSDERKEPRGGRYHDVPSKFLNCFVCNKEMWDGESMNKHIKGRAHKQMLKSLEESIHITVNILRENMRLAEEKKVIEWNRMHRLKKFNKYNEPESHCNMCDLKFLGKIITHRKTEAHQRLKRYLHPNCNICSKEFPSRIDWVEHRLTPDHLRKLNEVLSAKEGGIDGAKVVQEGEEEPDLEPILEESVQMEAENPVLELDDDLTGLQNLIPAYKKERSVSTKSLIPFDGFLCTLCNRSFHKEELAQSHLKSRRHYYAFIEAAKQKYKKQQDDAKKAEEEKKKKAKEEAEAVIKEETQEENNESQNGENEDQEMYDPEEACNGNNDDGEEEEENDDAAHVPEEEIKMKIEDVITEEMEEEQEEEEEEEKPLEQKPVPKSPATRGRRAGANRPCPKSKKLAGGANSTLNKKGQPQLVQQANKRRVSSMPAFPALLQSFRIPKIGAAAKAGASPKATFGKFQ